VAPRYLALIVATLIILGAGVHLFREVRAKPAPAEATAGGPKPPEPEAPPVVADRPPIRDAAIKPPMMGLPAPKTPSPPDEAKQEIAPAPTPSKLPQLDREPESAKANPKLDAAMAEANKAYDKQDYDEAKQLAQKVLARAPGSTRMTRILVSASCLSGDAATAQKAYLTLPAGGPDRTAMKTRCSRDAGVELKDQ
jgi:type IV secretory pathway VirB10-like protein